MNLKRSDSWEPVINFCFVHLRRRRGLRPDRDEGKADVALWRCHHGMARSTGNPHLQTHDPRARYALFSSHLPPRRIRGLARRLRWASAGCFTFGRPRFGYGLLLEA